MVVEKKDRPALAGQALEVRGEDVISRGLQGEEFRADFGLVVREKIHGITARRLGGHAAAEGIGYVFLRDAEPGRCDGYQRRNGGGGGQQPDGERQHNGAEAAGLFQYDAAFQVLRHGDFLELGADDVVNGALLLEPGGEHGIALGGFERLGHFGIRGIDAAGPVEREDFPGLPAIHWVPPS